MPNLGFPELLIILVVALLLFGRRLPEVARSLGKGITEFKRGMREIDEDVHAADQAPPAPSKPAEGAGKDSAKAG